MQLLFLTIFTELMYIIRDSYLTIHYIRFSYHFFLDRTLRRQ